MASHEELLAELPKLEKLSNAARLKLARKRRQKQLKKYQETVRVTNGQSVLQKKVSTKVSFSSNSLLHDLVLRNDVIEGTCAIRCHFVLSVILYLQFRIA